MAGENGTIYESAIAYRPAANGVVCGKPRGNKRGPAASAGLCQMILHNIQPEQQLCLILARKDLSLHLRDRAELLVRGELNWDAVWDFSVKHRVFPLVFRHLESFESGLAPPRIMRSFHVLSLANSRKSDALAKELARIIEILDKAGIGAIPFKGPALGRLVWGDHRLWSGQDLDILVRKKEVTAARDLLRAEGYRIEFEWGEAHGGRPGLLARGKPAMVVLAREETAGTIFVDLHESLFPWRMRRRRLDEQVWEDARRGDIFGASGLVLARSWNFILLSLHAAKHLFVLLRWTAELHELWHSADTEQDVVVKKSEEFDLKAQVMLAIAVCERLLGEDTKADSIADKGFVRRLSKNVFRRSLSPISAALLELRLPGSVAGKVNRLATSLLEPTIIEQELVPLPRGLRFLYHGIRPVRLMLKHGLERPAGWRRKG